MDHVFATETRVVSHPTTGIGITVNIGEHWSADDPVVKAYPAIFTDDARYGLRSSLPLGDDGLPVAPAKTAAPAKKASAKKASKGRGSRRARAAATETATSAPGERRSRTATAPADDKTAAEQAPGDKPGPKASETADEKVSESK